MTPLDVRRNPAMSAAQSIAAPPTTVGIDDNVEQRAGSLTQMLRERDDAVLTRLLLDRPDLAFPAPTDFSQVASRATTRHSVSGALGLLNAFELWVALRACAMTAPFAAGELTTEGADEEDVSRAVSRLLDLGLIWGHPDKLSWLRPVRAMPALLEGDDAGAPPPSVPPTLASTHRKPSLVDKVASGSAFEFVRRMDVLVEHCGHHQPARLRRSGGLATREVRSSFAALLDVPSAVAAVDSGAGACLRAARPVRRRERTRCCVPRTSSTAGRRSRWPSSGLSWPTPGSSATTAADASGSSNWSSMPSAIRPGWPGVITPVDVQRWLAWHRPRRPDPIPPCSDDDARPGRVDSASPGAYRVVVVRPHH